MTAIVLPPPGGCQVAIAGGLCGQPGTSVWEGGCVHEHITADIRICDDHRAIAESPQVCIPCQDDGHECIVELREVAVPNIPRTHETTGAGPSPAPAQESASATPRPPGADGGTLEASSSRPPAGPGMAAPGPATDPGTPSLPGEGVPVFPSPPAPDISTGTGAGGGTDRAAGTRRRGPGSPTGSAEGAIPGDASSAGATYVIELPAGLKMLSQNDRLHWAARNRIYQSLKKAAWAMTLQAKLPRLERVEIQGIYDPPDRRRRDGDNYMPALKAVTDGIVAADCLPDDNSKHVVRSWCEIGDQVHPRGRLRLIIREVTS